MIPNQSSIAINLNPEEKVIANRHIAKPLAVYLQKLGWKEWTSSRS
jgi:hypothetical protein